MYIYILSYIHPYTYIYTLLSTYTYISSSIHLYTFRNSDSTSACRKVSPTVAPCAGQSASGRPLSSCAPRTARSTCSAAGSPTKR